MLRSANSEGVECASDYFDVDVQVLRTWEAVFTLSVGCTYGYSHSSPSGLRNISNKYVQLLRSCGDAFYRFRRFYLRLFKFKPFRLV